MTIQSFDEKELILSLTSLPSSKLTAFAIAAATRQLTSYERFASKFGLENFQRPREVIDRLWADQQSEVSDRPLWSGLLEEVLALIPEEGDGEPWSIDHSLADDALSSLAYAIRCHLAPDPQEAAWAARRAYEAADQAAIRALDVQPGSSMVEAEIRAHAFVQRELERQREDLASLRRGLVDEVKRRAADRPLLTEQEVQTLRNI
jgi:hypothetical protein